MAGKAESATLKELRERREAYRLFREDVEADLKRQRQERLAAEQLGIEQLIIKAASEGATQGEIKRAYGTKDHRTISSVINAHGPEIAAMRKARAKVLSGMPDWLTFVDYGFQVVIGEHGSDYTFSEMDDGTFLFSSTELLWNDDYSIKNEAVELLDGKTENDSDEARLVASFIRKQR